MFASILSFCNKVCLPSGLLIMAGVDNRLDCAELFKNYKVERRYNAV